MAVGVTGAAIVLALAGCGDDEVVLGDEVLALYVSPQSSTSGLLNDDGRVYLIDADGSHQEIETSVMDVGELEWTEDGLHFADSESDYRLDRSGLEVVESPKPDMQASLHDMGDVVVGIYNEGLVDEMDYQMRLVEAGPQDSTSAAITGVIGAVSRCDDTLYGVGQATGPFLEEYPPGADGAPSWVLYELWPGPQQVIGAADRASADDVASDAPCDDGVIYSLNVASDDPSTLVDARHVLVSWDTRTGERTETDLVSASGDRIALDVDGLWQFDSASLVDGELRWMFSDGVVRSTDVASGVTEPVVETGLTEDAPGSAVRTAFAGDLLFALAFPGEGGGDGPVLHQFSLETGSGEVLFTASGIDPVVSPDMVPRGIAISPEVGSD